MRSWRNRWNNSEGQIAVFLALVFQVLFVFFAMSVNVAMIVYQKINLQNAVDLAAYYGAMKQAEVLNTIAHVNLQIRQSYKLMSWRYRVLGDFGRTTHPGFMFKTTKWNGQTPDEVYNPELINGHPDYEPAVCVSHAGFTTTNPEENLCKNQAAYQVPVFKVPAVAFDPFGFGSMTQSVFMQAINVINLSCNSAGKFNWLYGAMVMHIYRMDMRDRRQWIQALAQGLSWRPDDFLDLEGNPVTGGIEKTFVKNLSQSNARGVVVGGRSTIDVYNSLGQGKWSNWLMPIPVAIRAKYTGTTGGGNQCGIYQKYLNEADPSERMAAAAAVGVNNPEFVERLYQATLDGPVPDFINNDFIYVVGYEKNPWQQAYVGVAAKARPLRLFTPFGGTEVTLRARAFAKPFGGRIGPWYNSSWPRSEPRSRGGGEVDPLLPVHGGDYAVMQASPDLNKIYRTHPNYSRFPRDPYGLKSKRALTMIGVGDPYGAKVNPIQIFQVYNEYQDYSKSRDPIVWNVENPALPPALRDDEKAATAPDIFDATYYSADPNYMQYAYTKLMARWQASEPSRFVGRRPEMPPPADLGTHFGNIANPESASLNVIISKRFNQTPNFNERYAQYFWHINDWRHLLTGWVSASEGDYTTFPSQFAKCQTPAAPMQVLQEPQIYSGCAQGGRAGYSVKLVSGDYLNSNHSLSGEAGGAMQPLLNPPGAWPEN